MHGTIVQTKTQLLPAIDACVAPRLGVWDSNVHQTRFPFLQRRQDLVIEKFHFHDPGAVYVPPPHAIPNGVKLGFRGSHFAVDVYQLVAIPGGDDPTLVIWLAVYTD